jgi:hypothetical protein
MAKGRKSCPECNTEVGIRTFECSCGYNFYPGKERKVKETVSKEAKVYDESGKGRKQCLKCNVFVASCYKVCICGNKFEKKQVVVREKVIKTYPEGGRAKKQCPECSVFILGKERICVCGHKFPDPVLLKEKKRIEKIEEKSKAKIEEERVVIIKLPPIPTGYMSGAYKETPEENAERILGYGKERSLRLLKQKDLHGGWKHVNWDTIRSSLDVK